MIDINMNIRRGFAVTATAVAIGLCTAGATAQDAATATAPATAKDEAATTQPAGKITKESREVLREAVEAMGGKKAVNKIKTLQVNMSMSAQGQSLDIETAWAKDGGRYMKQAIPGMGEMVRGFDGKTGWSVNPMTGPTPLSEREIEEVDDQASMHMNLLRLEQTAKKDFSLLEVVDTSMFDDRECKKLHFVYKDKDVEGYIFFDAKTKLPVGYDLMDEEKGADMIMTLSEWEAIDGVKFFRKMMMAGGGMTAEVNITDVKVNAVDKSIFAAPAELTDAGEKKTDDGAAASASGKSLEDFTPEEQAQIKQMLQGFEDVDDPQQLEDTAMRLSQALGFAPPEQRDVLEYVIGDLKKRAAALRGG
jgi:hypothetical protein